ncbi:unnamed protein product (macronuclear) [Paramecium tetraurelia]|uniref:Transmembrane protein n=1 Tax=Paramecium tetraurelia TaxID=5888 RepID=A0DFC9_PARTE|nr:uncharacterized protein GSPATT00016559001 [Paramecium tetraurelia]CAK81746.1 unnamed protein product [Paramecium tetraurelia]|eukprot:XP_001449143.1 hypothetical protein (macronuclear) [Paramecium tetraurelia strain d4-2]
MFKPYMMNLYYFCGIALFAYLRFGTEGTQIPYDQTGSTNGKYYYIFGTNSNIQVENQYYLNSNYTSTLLHDCDFTLFVLLLLILLCIPKLFYDKWPKLIQELTIYYLEGSIFELAFGSVGQITQTIQNSSKDPLDIIFCIMGGILLLFYLAFTMRPLITIKDESKKDFLNYFTKATFAQQNKTIYLVHYFICIFNELLMGIIPIAINKFVIVFYLEIGANGVLIVLQFLILFKSKNLKDKLINITNIISYCLLITSYVLVQQENYELGFIVLILLSIYFIINIITTVLQIIVIKSKGLSIVIQKVKQNEQNVNLQTNIELQSVTLQLDLSQQINQTVQQQSKFMLTSQISNINHTKQQMSQFNSHNTSTEFLKDDHLVINNQIVKDLILIKRSQSYEITQFIDSGQIQLNKILLKFKFCVKVFNGGHEVDQKILKRNNIGNKIIGVHTFTLDCLQNCVIEEMQIKTYYSGQLLQRDIKLVNKQMFIGQSLEISHQHQFEQSDSWNEKLAIKLIIDTKVFRFTICNNELKLIQLSTLTQKSIQKLIDNGIQKYVVLFEQRVERFNFEKVVQFCQHYKLYRYEIASAESEYRNQELSSNFGKIQLIIPGTPYIRLILSIEQQINKEYLNNPQFIDSNIDLKRIQYIIVSIYAKRSSHQLGYAHKRVCECFGKELMNYFNQ